MVAVGLTIARHVWCWPVGLVQVALYTKVFFDAQLYSQTLLQVVFAILQIHGWWQWRMSLREPQANKGTSTAIEQVEVEQLSLRSLGVYIAIAVAFSLVLGGLMMAFTSAKWAMADAWLAGFSLVAQWLLIHRKLENWYLWLFVNILSIIVFSAQGLWPTVVLYIVFFGMAVHGLRVWHRSLHSKVAI